MTVLWRILVAFGRTCVVLLATSATASAARNVPDDAPLLAALRSDRALGSCGCIAGAAWLDESYPRLVVDASRWNALAPRVRMRFAERALVIAERVYLAEFASADQYERIFIVDRRGRSLLVFGNG